MKFIENIQAVAALQPDYLGFIFYEKSKRNFEGIVPELPNQIKKVGVFVNEHLEIVTSLVEEYQLDAVQLHGDESVEYIQLLKENLLQAELVLASHKNVSKKNRGKNKKNLNQVQVIKVFGIKDEFNFDVLKPYLEVVDYFLFDTKGKERGGNGISFNWNVLKDYPFAKPYFLSGGIGLENSDALLSFLQNKEFKYCIALDVNSKFEDVPGLKSVEKLKEFNKRRNLYK